MTKFDYTLQNNSNIKAKNGFRTKRIHQHLKSTLQQQQQWQQQKLLEQKTLCKRSTATKTSKKMSKR